MSQKHQHDIKVGTRVATLHTNGTPTGTIGTVKQVRNHPGTEYALVQYDNDDSRWNTDKPTRRAPLSHLKMIGCVKCSGTGVTAECREGTTYPSACTNCFGDATHLGYLWNAEDYKLIANV